MIESTNKDLLWALYYESDAFSIGGDRIMGRQAAGHSMLKAYANDPCKHIGVYTKSKLAKSINSFALTEIKKRNKYKTLNLIKASDKEVIKGFHLLAKEGLFLDGSSSAIIGSLNQIKHKNICCVLSGAALNNLTEVQKIISKMKN